MTTTAHTTPTKVHATGHDHCRTHGDVLAIRGACPWCDEPDSPLTSNTTACPAVSEDMQLALEAMTLFHLTEPKGRHDRA